MKQTFTGLFLLLAASTITAQQRGDIVSFDSIQAYTAVDFGIEVQTLTGLPGSILGSEYDFTVYRVLYHTQDYHPDSLTIASGLVCIPVNYACPELGLMSYGHGLCLKNDQVPSNNQPSNGYALICKGMAANGFVGVAPDYIHMSQWASPGPQAFIHARTEANSTIDLLRAARTFCASKNITLSGQVFLSGYSQGGHSTVATAKVMQEEYPSEFNVLGAVAGGGSYDLSGVCADSLTSITRKTPEKHSLPLVIRSLGVVNEDSLIAWGTGITMENLIDTIFKSPYKELLPALLDRYDPNNDTDFLDSIPARMIEDQWLIPFQTDPDHFFRRLLADNNVDDWAPQMPLVLYHSDADIENPYPNAVNTLALFEANGAPDVTLNTVADMSHGEAGQFHVLFTLNYMKDKRQDCLTSVADIANSSAVSLHLFPNPTSDVLHVSVIGAAHAAYSRVRLFNAAAELISQTWINQQTALDVSTLPAGMYLVSVEGDTGARLMKVVVISR